MGYKIPDLGYLFILVTLFPNGSMGYNFRSGGLMDFGDDPSWLAGMVLGGNYGSYSPPPSSQNQGPGDADNPNSLLNPMVLTGLKPPVLGDNYKSDGNSKIVKIGAKDGFVEIFLKCIATIKYCILTAIGAPVCPLACLLDNSAVARHLIYMLTPVTKFLCYPSGSIFDTGFITLQDNADNLKRVEKYLFYLGADAKSFSIFSNSGAKSLPLMLIKYASSPIFDALKPVVMSIERSVSSVQAPFRSKNSFFNPICEDTDLTMATNTLAEQFIGKPFLADITLPGYFLLTTVVTLRMDTFIDSINAVYNSIKYITGAECSLIQYAETKAKFPCKEMIGKPWTGYTKKVPDHKEICGRKSNQPFNDLKKILPTIIISVNETGSSDVMYEDETDDAIDLDDLITNKLE